MFGNDKATKTLDEASLLIVHLRAVLRKLENDKDAREYYENKKEIKADLAKAALAIEDIAQVKHKLTELRTKIVPWFETEI